LKNDPNVTFVPATDDLFRKGFDLFSSRSDKSWTLTDCISFIVMEEAGLTEALTGDRHFVQAGFEALLLET
jgi:predicted nucleic acid-binding protein